MAPLMSALAQATRSPASKAIRKSVFDIAQESLGRRVKPASTESVVSNIKKRAPEIRQMREGFTYDPVRDRFLSGEAGDVGVMMAVRPERKIGERLVNEAGDLSPQEIDRLFSENPQMLEDLRRGAMLGGYASGNRGFVLDASRRYGSLTRAKRKGQLTKQDSGFDLQTGDFPKPFSRYTSPPSLAALGVLAGDTEV